MLSIPNLSAGHGWQLADRIAHEATQPGLCVPPAADGRPSAVSSVHVPLHAIDLSTAAAQRSLLRVASGAPWRARLSALVGMRHGPLSIMHGPWHYVVHDRVVVLLHTWPPLLQQ